VTKLGKKGDNICQLFRSGKYEVPKNAVKSLFIRVCGSIGLKYVWHGNCIIYYLGYTVDASGAESFRVRRNLCSSR
jgi:hypothetical protein